MSRRRFGADPLLGRTIVVAQIAAAIAFVVVLLGAQGVRLPFTGDDGFTAEVVLADAGGMPKDGRAPVLVSGVPSGKVSDLEVRGRTAVARIRLDGDADGVVRTDARATVQPRSALNDLTIDIDPGSPSAPALDEGGRISASRTRSAVTLDQVAGVLDADTRAQLSVILGELAASARDEPGALRAALQRLKPLADAAEPLTRALDRRRTRLTRLVGSLDRMSATLAERDVELARTLRAGRATLDVTARRGAEVERAVAGLPRTLDAVRGGLTELQELGAPLDPALERLRPAARRLPALEDDLRDATPALRALLTDVAALADDGAGPAKRARSILAQARPLARDLREPVGRAEPVVDAIDARGEGIGTLGERFSGVLSTNDANGPILRGLGFFEPFSPANFGFPSDSKGAALARQKAGVVTALTRTCRTNAVACLVRYLVPGLPGSVRQITDAVRPRR